MARSTLLFRRVLAQEVPGLGPLGKFITFYRDSLALFSARERNFIVREALAAGAEFWIREYLILRFTNPGYVRSELGYFKGGRQPFVDSGDLAAMAMGGARVEARASGVATAKEKVAVTIRIPTPPYVNQNKDVRENLRKITSREIRAIARVADESIRAQLTGAEVSMTRRGKKAGQIRARLRAGIMPLTPAQQRRQATQQATGQSDNQAAGGAG